MSGTRSELVNKLQVRLHELSDEYQACANLQKMLLKNGEDEKVD